MKVRTFLFIILAMVVLYGLALLFVDNRETLERQVHVVGGFDLPVGVVLVLFMLIGVLITLLAGLAREASITVERWREKQESKRSEDIEERYSLGLAAVLEGREEEALLQFRKVLELDSRHFNTLLKVGEVLRHQGRQDDAVEYHRKAHHLKEDDARPLYALVEDYEAKGDLERARAVLGRIIAIKKHSVSAWRKLRSLHIKEKNWAKALEAQEQVEKRSGGSDARDEAERRVGRGIRYEMAVERLADGKSRDAATAFRRLLKDDAQFIPAWVRLGEALRQDGLDAEAVEAWYSGFEATGSPIFLTVLEEHFLQREQPLAAIEALKRSVSRARKDTIPRFYLGKLYFRLEMLDDALAVLSSLEGRASYAPTLHYLLGRIHERRKNHRDASVEYRKVIKEMELVQLEYRCRSCGESHEEWSDRCAVCGEWNVVEVNFREEISFEDLGLSPAPVYTSRK
jgi:lipopolysaccharide biosynthesis regulator YciM